MEMNPMHYLWTERYRPNTLDGYIGNENYRKDLERWIQEGTIPNIILSGKAGCGKTTSAKLIVNCIDCDSLYINASSENGIETIREKVNSFASSASFKPVKIIILDESDFLTGNAQSALRNTIETFSLNTRFIFTCNYFERMLEPIQSRLERYELHPPTKQELAKKCKDILEQENIKFDLKDIASVVNLTFPDNRQTLIKLQSFSKTGTLVVTDSTSDVGKVSDELIGYLKSKNLNKIRKIVIDLQLRDYTGLYILLSERLDDWSNNSIDPWYIAESAFQSTTSPDKQICFLGLCSRIINNK